MVCTRMLLVVPCDARWDAGDQDEQPPVLRDDTPGQQLGIDLLDHLVGVRGRRDQEGLDPPDDRELVRIAAFGVNTIMGILGRDAAIIRRSVPSRRTQSGSWP